MASWGRKQHGKIAPQCWKIDWSIWLEALVRMHTVPPVYREASPLHQFFRCGREYIFRSRLGRKRGHRPLYRQQK